MKKILLSTLLIFNILTALNSQIVVGTPSGISGAIFRNNLLKAFKSVTEMGFLRAEMKKELEKSRIEYWSKYPNISEDSPIASNYYYWLTQKDFYTLGIAISNYIENSVDKNRWDNNSQGFRGTADLLAAFVGGKQEDMIEPYAKDTYKNWEESVISYWRDNGFGIFDGKTLLDSYEKNTDLYEAHFHKVLLAEYLFHNSKSPLTSDNPKTVLEHIYLISNPKNDSEINAYVEGLNRHITYDEMKKGVEEWKNYYADDDSWLKKLSREARNTSPIERLEWFIIKSSNPNVYALFNIKRRFLFDWEMAEKILQNRIKRYGKNKVDMAIQKIWENRDNSKYRCIGDPYNNRNEKRLNEIGLNWYSIKSNEDCLCEELDGNTVLWYDLYDMMTSHNLDDLKRGFIKRNNISNQQYANLVSVLSPELLLFAEYLQEEYGDILYMADEFGFVNYELLETVSDTDRPNVASAIIRIMDGLAEIRNHKETHLAITYWKKNISNMSWELSKKEGLIDALEKAVENTLNLYEKFGKEKVLIAFQPNNQSSPDPFTNIFSLKSRWSSSLIDKLILDLTNVNRIPNETSKSNSDLADSEYLKKNKENPNIIITNSGLQYEIISEGLGMGLSPKEYQTVEVNLIGSLIDGTVFTDTYKAGTTSEFPLSKIIVGLKEGIQLMKVGAKYRFYIPSELGYGSKKAGDIKPNSTLIFEVELISIK